MRASFISSLGLLVGVAAASCSGSGDDCSSNGTCLSPDAGGIDAVADVQPDVPSTCDLTADLASSPACIDDGVGVFVDGANGNDANPGTKEAPFKTLAKGIAAAGALPRVYVCATTYAEDLSLTQANAVSIYGGLQCGSWTYDGSMPVVGKSTVAARVDGVTKPVVLSDLTFLAAPGAADGESSVAAFVTGSADVTLRRVKLRPGAGKDGAAGSTGSNWSAVAQDDPSIAGKDANGGTGGGSHACTLCVDSVNSAGGGGGSGGLTATGGSAGTPNLSASPPDDGAAGSGGGTCSAGDNGANASPGTAAPGATVVGALGTSGWAPAKGGDGPNGGPGQGGGGGGGKAGITGSGGGAGGGCGGCGGAGGKGGGGGGASIGLAVVASKVTLDTCDVVTVAGGAGGAGSAGQAGQLGGYAGTASPGCAAGVGGQGGTGGAGGGGAGGISVGVVYTGQKPDVDANTSIVVPSTPAHKGAGGAPGVNDGVDGVVETMLQASSS